MLNIKKGKINKLVIKLLIIPVILLLMTGLLTACFGMPGAEVPDSPEREDPGQIEPEQPAEITASEPEEVQDAGYT